MQRKYFDMKNKVKLKIGSLLLLLFFSLMLQAQVRPHAIFDNNMVLQRDKPVKVWGVSTPSEKVKIEFGGQSNMEFDLSCIFHGDTKVLSARFPGIRLMTIPCSANQKPRKNFERINEYDSWNDRYDKKGYWFNCSPETVKTFSGLGYIFGRRIYMVSQVPVGLIDASWGGTTIEAWLSPKKLTEMTENNSLLKQWNDKVAAFNPEENLKTKIKNWEIRSAARKKEGLEPMPKPAEPDPGPALDRNFPGSSYNGMVAVIAGLTVKGIIFHQGYNNALGDSRPKLYGLNFKALVADWRETFADRNLPFGIIELSAGGEPQTLDNYELRMIDPAPYIREGQFSTYRDLKNVGFVCCYDQQVNWYHPQKKVEAGERMARWALSTQYGFDLKWEPAICKGIERLKDKIIVTFSKEVKSSDDRPIDGFSIAGSDHHFFPAKAVYVTKKNDKGQIIEDNKRIEVWNNLTVNPLELRYAWARNPLGNLVNADDRIIPVPLFRTDNWEFPEAPYLTDEYEVHRKNLEILQKQAEDWAHLRIISEAEQILKENQ